METVNRTVSRTAVSYDASTDEFVFQLKTRHPGLLPEYSPVWEFRLSDNDIRKLGFMMWACMMERDIQIAAQEASDHSCVMSSGECSDECGGVTDECE